MYHVLAMLLQMRQCCDHLDPSPDQMRQCCDHPHLVLSRADTSSDLGKIGKQLRT